MAALLAFASLLRDLLVTLVLAVCLSIGLREGAIELARKLLLVVRQLPGINWVIGWVLRREVRGFLRQLDPNSFKTGPKVGLAIPQKGNLMLKLKLNYVLLRHASMIMRNFT